MLFEWQAMDLRWGIREQSHNDHTIMEFCVREIENCKRTSVGPTFVVSSTVIISHTKKSKAAVGLNDAARSASKLLQCTK